MLERVSETEREGERERDRERKKESESVRASERDSVCMKGGVCACVSVEGEWGGEGGEINVCR